MLLLAAPAAAQSVEREDFAVVGWRPDCSVAINHLGFPYRGEAIYDEPVFTRIGTVTIPPGAERPRASWTVEWDGANTWKPEEARKALRQLVAAGFDKRGYEERIGEAVIEERPDLSELLRSTASLRAKAGAAWPAPPWKLTRIVYSPLTTCALVVYEHDRRFSYALARVHNTKVRPERARAHLTTGLLLFAKGDLEGALAETAAAAALYPDGAANRYHHAAMLSLSGELERAVEELREAVGLNPEYRAKAATDRDFENLQDLPAFRSLIKDAGNPKKNQLK